MAYRPCYIELVMKKYRIKNNGTEGYILQERFFLFAWYTVMESYIEGDKKVFMSIKDAKDYIMKESERRKDLKKAEYVEYV